MNKPLLSFITIIISLVFAFVYVRPEYVLVQERKGSLAEITNTLNNSEKIKTLISETEKSLGSVNPADLERFKVFLPETIDPIRFANNLQHIGLKNRIILEDINIEKPVSPVQASVGGVVSGGATHIITKASFSFTSTYEATQLFLNDLEQSLGLVDVTSLSFSPVVESVATAARRAKGSVDTPLLFRYMVTVETYSLK